jgi:putative transcriptional regulator
LRDGFRKGGYIVSTERFSNEEIRQYKGRIDRAKVDSATEEQIAAWKREDGFGDDTTLGAGRMVPPIVDVRALRERLGLSQEDFAAQYLLSPRTVQEWEQHRREPSEAARVLLYAIAQDPKAVARLLRPSAA